MGGALAELDSLYMALHLASHIQVKGVTYGTPRVGNSAYAKFFDSHVRQFQLKIISTHAHTFLYLQVPDFTRINNEADMVPVLPPRFLGFVHVHGEVHIIKPGNAVACSDDDDRTDAQCTDSTVPSIPNPLHLAAIIQEHLGPYEGIEMGDSECS